MYHAGFLGVSVPCESMHPSLNSANYTHNWTQESTLNQKWYWEWELNTEYRQPVRSFYRRWISRTLLGEFFCPLWTWEKSKVWFLICNCYCFSQVNLIPADVICTLCILNILSLRLTNHFLCVIVQMCLSISKRGVYTIFICMSSRYVGNKIELINIWKYSLCSILNLFLPVLFIKIY